MPPDSRTAPPHRPDTPHPLFPPMPSRPAAPALAGVIAALALALPSPAAGLDLRLPTENHHLFSNEPEKFYMYVPRTFEGETSQPWQGGQFGFVRTPVRTDQGVVFTQFHEGIDIAPVKRDRAGNPLDLVNSVAEGTVVHANLVSGRSNYGKYVVVQHNLSGGAFFSVYAHLAEITCKPGDAVRAGSALGRMGYTGAGISRPRAHVHLEFALLLHTRFDDWQSAKGAGTNYHGIYNGMNLIGLDVAELFLQHRAKPDLSLPEFVRSTPAHFKVTVPRQGPIDLVSRNPWLLQGQADAPSPSWEISFAATGFPVAVAPSHRPTTQPLVTFVRPASASHRHLTRGLLSGQGSSASLSRQGLDFIQLITGNFPNLAAKDVPTKKS